MQYLNNLLNNFSFIVGYHWAFAIRENNFTKREQNICVVYRIVKIPNYREYWVESAALQQQRINKKSKAQIERSLSRHVSPNKSYFLTTDVYTS